MSDQENAKITKINRSEIKKLEDKIIRYRIAYYQGRPEISDVEYDALEEKLQKIHPHSYVFSMVGSANKKKKGLSKDKNQSSDKSGGKIPHKKKMLSLLKTYDKEELKSWMGSEVVVSTDKLDGVSCSLVYQEGELIIAKTRGDGSVGEDILGKVWWIESIPKYIKDENIEVRGEIYCNEENFLSLAKEMDKRKLERPTSQRNIVAGLLGRKDHLDLCMFLQFMAFELISNGEQEGENNGEDSDDDNKNGRNTSEEGNEHPTEYQKYQDLKKLGFDLPNFRKHTNWKTVEETLAATNDFMLQGEYQIDGVVFTYNDLRLHKKLGATSHHPRYKIAFKFRGEERVSTINKIIWSVSRNGVLTPVAEIEPVELAGAIISRVTLHNYGIVRAHKLKEGDQIRIIRSGEVIPKFLSVEKSFEQGKMKIPSHCPSCHGKVREEGIRLICDNPNCVGRNKDSILNFIRNIGIENLSEKRLQEMMEKGLVKDIPDLYNLTKEDFLSMDKVKDKLAEKWWNSINSSKRTDLVTFLSSLGLIGMGRNKCEKIVRSGYNTIEKLKTLRLNDLIEIDSFAEQSGGDFLNSLQSKWPLIDTLIKKGFTFVEDSSATNMGSGIRGKENPLISEKSFCITGELSMKRAEVEKLIKSQGGQVLSAVTKNTNFLVTNEKESSSNKFQKAKSLGIPIISEEDLMKMLSIQSKG